MHPFWKGFTIWFVAICAVLYVVGMAVSHPVRCGLKSKMVKALNGKYGEQVTFVGVVQNGKAAIHLYTSENGTWTMLAVNPNGSACIYAAGATWTNVTPKKKETKL